tara:strand:+ start:3688 stop:5013 length:1326 start_codon:yes stop_codon:yes gene_type:complete
MITGIRVEKLFYEFTYEISPDASIMSETSNLLLLYGNNGSGKTTILNVLYHLLDPEPYGGHRTFVGKTPFQKFEVRTSLGYTVSAIRQPDVITGPYELRVTEDNGGIVGSYIWEPKSGREGGASEREYDKICQALASLKLSFHYLRDSRRVESGSQNKRVIDERARIDARMHRYYFQSAELDLAHEGVLDSTDELLLASLSETVDWIRTRSISSTNDGYTNVNTVYLNVIKRITSKMGKSISSIADLADMLRDLAKENEAFSRFGLTPPIEVDNLTRELEMGDPSDLEALNAIIGPYIEGHTARLEALNELRGVIQNFVSTLEEFYEGKKVKYDIRGGIEFYSKSGHKIEPTELSSGERQLLLLFCNAIISRDHRTILIIDEPEISLNVKWQRSLIPALLRCLEGTEYQLLIATHSVEILSQYRSQVHPLRDHGSINLEHK